MDHVYSLRWHDERRQPIDPMTEDEARAAWERGPLLSVSGGEGLGDGTGGVVPAYTIEMDAHAESCRVVHYNAVGSRAAEMDWRTEKGRLFLFAAIEYLHHDEEEFYDIAKASREFFFRPDGYCELTTQVAASGAVTVEEFSDVDVSSQWVDPLTWGDLGPPRIARGRLVGLRPVSRSRPRRRASPRAPARRCPARPPRRGR